MSDYGLMEIARESAVEEARQVAARLRRLADRVDVLANDAEGATDAEEKIAALGQRVSEDVLGTLPGLGLGTLIQHSATWAGQHGRRSA